MDQQALQVPDWLCPHDDITPGTTWLENHMGTDVVTWGDSPMAQPQSRLAIKERALAALSHQTRRLQKRTRSQAEEDEVPEAVEGQAEEDEVPEVPPDPNEVMRNAHLDRKRKEHLEGRGIDWKQFPHYLPPPLKSLGKVASKRLLQDHFDKFWVEGVHQNFIAVGSSVPSPNSRANAARKWKKRGMKQSNKKKKKAKWASESRSRGFWGWRAREQDSSARREAPL